MLYKSERCYIITHVKHSQVKIMYDCICSNLSEILNIIRSVYNKNTVEPLFYTFQGIKWNWCKLQEIVYADKEHLETH
jgi:hypothetical protein